jgi:hypothetical protein
VSSEVAVVSGEGYDHLDRAGGTFFSNSIEGRVTGHLFGNGDRKVDPWKDEYLDASFNTVNSFNQNGANPGANGPYNHLVYQFHAVYNRPLFLVAAQYIYNQDRFRHQSFDNDNHGFSVNADVRPFVHLDSFGDQRDKWSVFGRFDYFDIDNGDNKRYWIYGAAYRVNRYLRLILNGATTEHRYETGDLSRAMFTAEVNW